MSQLCEEASVCFSSFADGVTALASCSGDGTSHLALRTTVRGTCGIATANSNHATHTAMPGKGETLGIASSLTEPQTGGRGIV